MPVVLGKMKVWLRGLANPAPVTTLREPEDQVPTREEASCARVDGRVERARANRCRRNMFSVVNWIDGRRFGGVR